MVQGFESIRTNLHECGARRSAQGPLSLWVDKRIPELRILPSSTSSPSVDEGGLLLMRLRVSVENSRAASARLAGISGTSAIHLRIHPSFLPSKELPALFGTTSDPVDIEDAVAAELALGLLASDEAVGWHTYSTGYAAGMLCARLAEVLTKKATTQACRFQNWQLCELKELLSRDHEENTSISVTAARCRLSVCHFSRLFKATYGMPLHKYLVNERVKRAQTQLTHTGAPISEIALDCGFADQSSFTRRFSSVAGIPPALWRRQSRETASSVPVSSAATFKFKSIAGMR